MSDDVTYKARLEAMAKFAKTTPKVVRTKTSQIFVVIEPVNEGMANVLGAFTDEADADKLIDLLWDMKSDFYSPNAYIEVVYINPDMTALYEELAYMRRA